MGDELTYRGALKILGKPESRLVKMLDAAATAGLGAWATVALASGKAAEMPLSLVEIKNDVVGFGHEIVRRVSEWRSGLSRFDRSQRLAAAHTVLVISSFFEALEQVGLPFPVELLALTDAQKAGLVTGQDLPGGYGEMVNLLASGFLPMPQPHRTLSEVHEDLAVLYGALASHLLFFAASQAILEGLDDEARGRLRTAVRELPDAAMERYNAAYRNLATENREFEIWAGLTERRELDTALAGVSTLLADMTARQPGPRSRSHLTMAYQSSLSEPIVGSGQAPDGVVLPSLGEGYVSPRCRIAEVQQEDSPADREWWGEQRLVEDVNAFLAGHLTSLRAVRAPLVVLGEPGSGKSTFMQVLAARLTGQDFLPVLVSLRDVSAESIVQEQIEQAIYQGPGDRVNWAELVDTAHGALPVVLLDGFDELIQAATVSRYDYLEQVKDFQRRQAQIGRPVAVIVTSRTVVADKARFPAESLALQLQPFTEGQIRRWLEIWERHNTRPLAARGLRSLPASTTLAHRELAEQPLLLLMLAIFDAAENELQRAEARIGHADLYERLLTEFALREIVKSAPTRALSADRQLELAEKELQRLAVVALAMFARGRQSASEAELNRDLPVLFPEDDVPGGEEAPLTRAQRATGRFFFVHKSEAQRYDNRTRSYEFLHATFGEFLVARLTVSALRDLAALREVTRHGTTAQAPLDDGFLYAVLSFYCLAIRPPIITFLHEIVQQMPAEEGARCRAMLAELIAGSLFPQPSRSFQDYQPEQFSIPRRLAVYSANLVVLLVLMAGEVDGTEFCGPEVGKVWEQYGYLWRSVFRSAEWNGLRDTIRVKATRSDGPLEIRLTREDESPVSPTDSLVIQGTTYQTEFDIYLSGPEGVSYDVAFPSKSLAGRVFRNAGFMPSWHDGVLFLLATPALYALGGEAKSFIEDRQFLPGYLLACLDYGRRLSADARAELYRSYKSVLLASSPLGEQLLLRLREDARTFPPEVVIELMSDMRQLTSHQIYMEMLNDLWRRPDTAEHRTTVLDFAARLPESILGGLDPELRSAIALA